MINIRSRISVIVALTLTLGVVATTTASARPNLDPIKANAPALGSGQPDPAPGVVTPTIVRVIHVYDRPAFDWGDAGIGAGGLLALVLVALGGTLTIRSHTNNRGRLSSCAPAKHARP